MNRLDTKQRAKIIGCLVEGCSMRATARMCGVSFNTVLKFVPMIGRACSIYQDEAYRNLNALFCGKDVGHRFIGLTKCNTGSFIQHKHFLYYNMSKKSKMGRPKLPKGEARIPFAIRFSESELVAFERKAVPQGLTVRAWITAVLTDAAK